jgi:hypothetical protein
MREQVIQVVEQYIDAVRHDHASALPLHPEQENSMRRRVCGISAFRKRGRLQSLDIGLTQRADGDRPDRTQIVPEVRRRQTLAVPAPMRTARPRRSTTTLAFGPRA